VLQPPDRTQWIWRPENLLLLTVASRTPERQDSLSAPPAERNVTPHAAFNEAAAGFIHGYPAATSHSDACQVVNAALAGPLTC
jgi:hypothetical protein